MKQIFVTILFFCILLNYTFSQEQPIRDYTDDEYIDAPEYDLYLGLSSGINYFTGMLGPNIEVRAIKNLTFNGGIGIGGWGYKASGGLRYYINYPAGISFNVGYSWTSGLDEFIYEFELQNGSKQDVELNLLSASVVNLSIAYHWKIKQRIRINIETGYSVPTSSKAYEVVTNVELSDLSKTTLRIMQPGGLILGIGFSVGF